MFQESNALNGKYNSLTIILWDIVWINGIFNYSKEENTRACLSTILAIEMNVAHNSYYRYNKYLLSSIGQWPYQTKFQKFLMASLTYIVLMSIFLPEILGAIDAWGDIDTMIECMAPIIVRLTSIILITNCIYKKDKIEEITLKIEEDWATWMSTSEVEILHAYARKGQEMTILFSVCIFSGMFIFLQTPIVPLVLDLILPLNESRPRLKLLHTEYYLFEEENNYYFIYVHSFIGILSSIITLVSVDTMLMIFIYHACGIFAILGFRLESRLKKSNFSSIENINFQKQVHKEISFCVQSHKRVIVFVNDICDCYSNAYFLLMGFNMLVMSITGFQTVMKFDSPPEVVRYGSFTFSQMIHLFLLSIPCQQLIDHGISVADSMYNGDWYQLSTESQKMLMMIMRRCLNPCTFTAGKLYVFSMESFATVLRTSMSYFTVLLSVREK